MKCAWNPARKTDKYKTATLKWLFAVSGILRQNRNWFCFKFSAESSGFIIKNFKTEKFKFTFEGLSIKICYISPSDSEANRNGAYAESLFPLFFSFFASFRSSSPKEKVGKLSSFWDWWPSLCHSPAARVPTAFFFLPNFHSRFYLRIRLRARVFADS